MKSNKGFVLTVPAMLTALLTVTNLSAQEPQFTDEFMFETCKGFSSKGSNPFFILEPGYRLIYAGEEGGVEIGLTVTVLDQTRRVDGVRTRVIREVHTADGEIIEISRNYFAICNRTNSVVYFGEDVDNYEDGVIINHDGSWLAGVDGARAGIIMPGANLLGARYFQEVAPDVALDRAETVSLREVVQTPAGTFEKCLKTRETTALDPTQLGFKFYAPGIGLVQDGAVKLVEISEGDDDDDDEARAKNADGTSAFSKTGALPAEFSLSESYPNPFSANGTYGNPSAIIEYALPQASQVLLKVYDVLGNEIRTLVNDKQSAGYHRVQIDGKNLPGGVYLYRIQAGNFSQAKKFTLVK